MHTPYHHFHVHVPTYTKNGPSYTKKLAFTICGSYESFDIVKMSVSVVSFNERHPTRSEGRRLASNRIEKGPAIRMSTTDFVQLLRAFRELLPSAPYEDLTCETDINEWFVAYTGALHILRTVGCIDGTEFGLRIRDAEKLGRKTANNHFRLLLESVTGSPPLMCECDDECRKTCTERCGK